jgi:hypothetical protein
MEELEEIEPGFAIRSDEERERMSNKKKDSVLPIGDGEKQKVRNSAKKNGPTTGLELEPTWV